MGIFVLGLFVLGLMVIPSGGPASAGERQLRAMKAMTPLGEALPPPGYLVFCRNQPSDCVPQDDQEVQPPRIRLDAALVAELEQVNQLVNTMIKPVSDIDLYGEREFWAYPLREGDCEDYVLLKRQMLLNRGWPASVLLITVVRDELGEGHAVLTVASDRGDLILDNKQNAIRPWSQTPYEYIKRQSGTDPLVWISLAPAPINPENYAGVSQKWR